ncbi:hypothetical protein BDZ45DRAFT_172030 [Acephala macrosclerotiorum]|nr:hypothetical protein BDZ45DRAFT_172030 [Acephala macrosclerotiorum]
MRYCLGANPTGNSATPEIDAAKEANVEDEISGGSRAENPPKPRTSSDLSLQTLDPARRLYQPSDKDMANDESGLDGTFNPHPKRQRLVKASDINTNTNSSSGQPQMEEGEAEEIEEGEQTGSSPTPHTNQVHGELARTKHSGIGHFIV